MENFNVKVQCNYSKPKEIELVVVTIQKHVAALFITKCNTYVPGTARKVQNARAWSKTLFSHKI